MARAAPRDENCEKSVLAEEVALQEGVGLGGVEGGFPEFEVGGLPVEEW